MAYEYQTIWDDFIDSNDVSELDSSWKTGEVGWVGLLEGKIEGDELKHILVNNEEEVECQLCYKSFTKESLRLHILKEHWRNEVTKCSFCDEKFENINTMKSHTKLSHLKESTTCNLCHKEYKRLRDHMKFFHEKLRPFACLYCKKTFQSRNYLREHTQSIHLEEKIRCRYCKKDFSMGNLRRHIRESHDKVKKPCSICGKEFGMSNHRRHIRMVHNNESTKCPHCEKFIFIFNLKSHIQVVHNKLKKICELCQVAVPFWSMSVHKRKVHSSKNAMYNETLHHSPEAVLVKSSSCDLEIESKEQISNLKKKKHDKDYSAILSKEKLQNKSRLKKHNLSKNIGTRFHCNQCDYTAARNFSVRQHTEYVHGGVTYHCDQCLYKGPSTRQLQKHIDRGAVYFVL